MKRKLAVTPSYTGSSYRGGDRKFWILDQSVASRLNVFVRGSDVGSLDRAVPSIEIQLG